LEQHGDIQSVNEAQRFIHFSAGGIAAARLGLWRLLLLRRARRSRPLLAAPNQTAATVSAYYY
jgi:hypothetical protein